VDISTDDTLISSLIVAAREEFENQADKTLFTTTWKLVLDVWPEAHYIVLPRPPLVSVTSVVYTDDEGAPTTLSTSDYLVDTNAWPGRIVLKDSASWPSVTLLESGAIVVTYVAGYALTASIPQRYKQAILMLVGHWYENREAVQTTGAVPKVMPEAFDAIVARAKWETR
jgi:uncharacterized phiE125 gp8 family phage protein